METILNGTRTSGAHLSYWTASTKPLVLEKLSRNLDVDVVIVGGGIAGVSGAYNVLRAGFTVALVEDGFIGSGETGRTTAHLVTALDDRYYHLRKTFGEADTKLIAESHNNAIEFIDFVVHNKSIECDFVRLPGYLFLHPSDDPESLQKELRAAKAAGLDVTDLTDIPGIINKNGPCIRFNNQAQFHPLKYLSGLCKSIIEDGGLIFTETHAVEIDHTGIVSRDGYRINAKHIVIATNSPVNNKYMIHISQKAYRTYVIGARVKKGAVPEALWWDTGDHKVNPTTPPYHYIRIQSLDENFDLLICGGEDHSTGEDDFRVPPCDYTRYEILEDWARLRFPIEDVIYKWSGQVMEPADSIAYIGHNPLDKKNIYIATGDSGNGMTHGTIAGILIADLISGKENKFKHIYDPSRVRILKTAKTFIEELISGLSVHMKTKPEENEKHIDNIRPGDSQIIEIDGKRYGAHRDTSNNIHIVNAKCAHLGCTINWNPDEKTWDCPCHGSRYTFKGVVINGPANKDLDYHKIRSSDFSVLH